METTGLNPTIIESPKARVLVLDDEESVALTLSEVLRLEGYEVDMLLRGDEAISRFQDSAYDLVLTDLHMEGMDGISVLAELRRSAPFTVAIVLTGFASLDSAIGAIRHGAYDYLIKPCAVHDLKLTIKRGLEHRRLMLAEREARLNLELLNRELEMRVEERTADLSRANEDLARANQAKDIFFATLSHELRTPLTPILGWVKLLRPAVAESALLAQGLDAIERNARLQTRLIDDLLDISRIVSGKLHLEMEPTDLCSIVESAVETVREKAVARGIDLTVRVTSSPLVVQGSPVRLQQMVWNLLSNAIKFTGEGGRVDVDVINTGGEARIIVSDTGEGIEPAFLPSVFVMFSQADVSTTRRHGGLGLGLSIVRKLTELHGGSVHAESDGKGKGSRFTLVLPCAVTSRVDVKKEHHLDQLVVPGPVLIVDDSEDTLEMMRMFFNRAGCQTMVASSAEEALQLASEEPPAVVISDIGLPEADGYQMMEQLRQIPGLEKIPAIALSGYAMEEDLARATAAGFAMHIAKPVDPEKLIKLISTLISQ